MSTYHCTHGLTLDEACSDCDKETGKNDITPLSDTGRLGYEPLKCIHGTVATQPCINCGLGTFEYNPNNLPGALSTLQSISDPPILRAHDYKASAVETRNLALGIMAAFMHVPHLDNSVEVAVAKAREIMSVVEQPIGNLPVAHIPHGNYGIMFKGDCSECGGYSTEMARVSRTPDKDSRFDLFYCPPCLKMYKGVE